MIRRVAAESATDMSAKVFNPCQQPPVRWNSLSRTARRTRTRTPVPRLSSTSRAAGTVDGDGRPGFGRLASRPGVGVAGLAACRGEAEAISGTAEAVLRAAGVRVWTCVPVIQPRARHAACLVRRDYAHRPVLNQGWGDDAA